MNLPLLALAVEGFGLVVATEVVDLLAMAEVDREARGR